MNWISVENKLPDVLESVIVWGKLTGDYEFMTHEAFVAMGKSDLGPGKRFHSVRDATGFMDVVTHWMPMPAGPIGNPEADANRYYAANVSQ